MSYEIMTAEGSRLGSPILSNAYVMCDTGSAPESSLQFPDSDGGGNQLSNPRR